jgi:hypothetical protein
LRIYTAQPVVVKLQLTDAPFFYLFNVSSG